MSLLQQQISNHPLFPEVQRWVDIIGFSVSDTDKAVAINATLSYKKDEEDVSESFRKEVGSWVISNKYRVAVRDANMQPVENPEFEEITDEETGEVLNEADRYLRMGAYDYFTSLIIDKGLNIATALQAYIAIDDGTGRFNF